MFGTIRKHQTALWIVIIAVMGVSLLIFFVPKGGLPEGIGRDTANYGTISGKAVKEKEWRETRREVELNHFFRSGGNWPAGEEASGRSLENETIQRLLLIQKMKELGIQVKGEPGQTAHGTLTFPKPGTYTYYCSVSGHRESGMTGTLVVQ